METLPYTTITTVLVIGYTFWLSFQAGSKRGKADLSPPAMSGNADFEIANRIHCNSNEQLILLLPLVWLTAWQIGDVWSAVACVVWLIGRVLYRQAMLSDPSKRGTGMLITIAPTVVMAIALLVMTGLSLANMA